MSTFYISISRIVSAKGVYNVLTDRPDRRYLLIIKNNNEIEYINANFSRGREQKPGMEHESPRRDFRIKL